MTEHWKTIEKDVTDIVTGFLVALQDGRRGNYLPYTQCAFRARQVVPMLPLYQSFEITKVRKPTKGEDFPDDIARIAEVSLTIGRQRVVQGRLTVIREVWDEETQMHRADPEGEWGVCPTSWRPV